MSELVVKVVDESCTWGSGTDCCDSLESDLAGYPEGATWALPLQWRLQVLEARVSEKVGEEVRFEEASLLGLVGAERDAAVDALSAGSEFPLVILGGTLACAGELDISAIAEAVKAHGPGGAWFWGSAGLGRPPDREKTPIAV